MRTTMRGAGSLGAGACILAALLIVTQQRALEAQGFPGLVSSCAAADPDSLTDWCREIALAVQGIQAGAGLAVSGGSDLPGSGSTLGRRLGSTPRFSFHIGGNAARAHVPNVFSGTATPAPSSEFFIVSGRVAANAGVLDGFSLGPTVGGVFSVDVMASLNFLGLPSDEGFDSGLRGFGYGARVGLLRESFTLPGISVSWAHRGFDELDAGDFTGGDGARIDSDLNVTSIRATVGKEFFAASFLAGYGWDRYSSDVAITARAPGSAQEGTATARDLESRRTLWFASGSLNFLLMQLTGEAGWASGFDPLFPDRPQGGYDPGDASPFGTLALRITF